MALSCNQGLRAGTRSWRKEQTLFRMWPQSPSAKFGADICNPLFFYCIDSLAPTDQISLYSFAESQADTLIEEQEDRDASRSQWRLSTATLRPPTASASRGASTSNSTSTNAGRQVTGMEDNTATRRTAIAVPGRFLTKDELKEAERMKRLMEQKKHRERARAVMMKKKELVANKDWEGHGRLDTEWAGRTRSLNGKQYTQEAAGSA
jgi:hypothetical protein